MKAVISDRDALQSLKPLELVQYLRFKGWQQDSDLGDKATLWVRGDGAGADEIVLPKRRDFADFDLRMAEVLKILAKAEERSQLDILHDVQTASADLVRLRAPARDAADGSLAIDTAVSFVESARDLMMAATCAAIDKRSYFATRKAQQAIDYLDRVRMGQTERFRETSAIDDFELQGAVISLTRLEGAMVGRVTIAGFIEGQARKVQIDLPDPEYAKAITAHKQGAIVLCTGELVKNGRSYRLQNPRQFRLSGDGDGQV